jgi:hypothetical protein
VGGAGGALEDVGERGAEAGGEGGKLGEGFGGGGLEEMLDFAGDLGAVGVAEHAEVAGEFVGDVIGFEAGVFREGAGGGFGGGAVEEVEALVEGGEMLLPEFGEDVFDLFVAVVVVGGHGSSIQMLHSI